MFEGRAEEAMNFYVSLFENAAIKTISRYSEQGPGKAGTVLHAVMTIGEQDIMCIDSAIKHDFTFTPSMSLYVNCTTGKEFDALYEKLPEGGRILMPAGSYGFSKRFAWVADRYGVSWQLNLQE